MTNPYSMLDFDVIVIGGGPAGSTFSTFINEKGWRVLMLEKAHHPRFHIGESLLPMTLPILKKLGVDDQVKAIGMAKYGAEFNSASHQNQSETYYFDFALNKNHPHAYEVRRSEFDEILFNNAHAKGVDARQGIRVTAVDFIEKGAVKVSIETEDGVSKTYTAKYLIDASGRDTFLSRKLQLKQKSKSHNSAAIFGHFDKVVRRSGKDEGNISIYWFEHGWFWLIPLRDGAVSVGAVCYPAYMKKRDCGIEDFLWQTIKLCPAAWERMKEAKLVGKASATGNFSYFSKSMYGKKNNNYLLVGDAFAFIDPVFSSGVHIGMTGAVHAADAIDECLRHPEKAQSALRSHEKKMRAALKTFSWLIYRFNSPVIHNLFMAPGNQFRIQEAIISILAGDVYNDTRVGSRLFLFKIIYYVSFLANLPRALRFHLRRKKNIPLIFTGGSTPQDTLD